MLLHLYYFEVWRFSELRIFLFPNNLSLFAFVAAIIPCGLLRIIFLDFLIDLHDFQVKLVQFISVEDHSSLENIQFTFLCTRIHHQVFYVLLISFLLTLKKAQLKFDADKLKDLISSFAPRRLLSHHVFIRLVEQVGVVSVIIASFLHFYFYNTF